MAVMVNSISSTAPTAASTTASTLAAAPAATLADRRRALSLLAAGSRIPPDIAKQALEVVKAAMQNQTAQPATADQRQSWAAFDHQKLEGQSRIDMDNLNNLLDDGQFSGFLKNFALNRLTSDAHTLGAEGVEVRDSLQQTLTAHGLDPRDIDDILTDYDRRLKALEAPAATAASAKTTMPGRTAMRLA